MELLQVTTGLLLVILIAIWLFKKEKKEVNQYFKFPIKLYRADEFNKYIKAKMAEEQDEEIDEIDALVRKSLRGNDDEDVDTPQGTEVMVRIPTKDMETCSFHPTWSMDNQEELACTSIVLATGEEYLCTWSSDKLEKELIKAEIAHF